MTLVFRISFLSICLALLSGCDPRPTVDSRQFSVQSAYQGLQDVYVATNRLVSQEMGEDFSEQRALQLSYGAYRVSIPREHKTGSLETAPVHRSRPDRHFEVVNKGLTQSQRVFVSSINQALDAKAGKVGHKGILLFVHGFNYSFPETIFQTAQLAFDTRDQMVAVAFSWPSRGRLSGYGYDRESISFSRDDLVALLKLLSQTQADSIMLLSHSIGSELTMESLRQLSLAGEKDVLAKIQNLTMASPDLALPLFFKQLAAIDPLPPQLLVMTSDDDRALGLSRSLSRSQVRVGSVEDPSLLTKQGVGVVDISEIAQRGFINHSKFSKSPSSIALLNLLMRIQSQKVDRANFHRILSLLVGKTETYGLRVFPANPSALTP